MQKVNSVLRSFVEKVLRNGKQNLQKVEIRKEHISKNLEHSDELIVYTKAIDIDIFQNMRKEAM